MMTDIKNNYTRLSGRGLKNGGFFSLTGIRSLLFLGEDHLLCVYNKRFEEEYRRFYFKDIQALIVRRNRRDLLWNIIFLFLIIITLYIGTDLWPVAAFLGGLIFINRLLGPTCICHIQTAVSKEALPSLHRVKNAQKVINRIIPHIEIEQGRLEPDDIVENMQRVAEKAVSAEDLKSHAELSDHPANSYNGTIHKILYGLLLGSCLTTMLDLFFESMPTTFVNIMISSVLIILVITALVKQQGSSLRREIRRITWATMVYFMICLVIGYVGFILVFIKNPEIAGSQWNQWEMLKAISMVSVFDYPFFLGAYIVSIIYSCFAGIAGLYYITQSKTA